MCRVLFLDFDGVLMASPPRLGNHAFRWVPVLEAHLASHEDVHLVLHTSWAWDQSLEHLRKQLAGLGHRVLGSVSKGPRYEMILQWVSQRFVTQYRILDDDHKLFPSPTPAELILCDGRLGITDPAASAALARWLQATRINGERR